MPSFISDSKWKPCSVSDDSILLYDWIKTVPEVLDTQHVNMSGVWQMLSMSYLMINNDSVVAVFSVTETYLERH